MRPGRVIETCNDDLTIKASVPGLFSEEDEPDMLPPIYPLNLGPSNSFSSVEGGDEVWVMFFDDNPLELFWMRKDDKSEVKDDALDKIVDIICIRETDESIAKLYFNGPDGWMMMWKDSKIQICENGDIILTNGEEDRMISITGDCVSVGGSAEPAVLGDRLTTCLDKLTNVLLAIESSAGTSPYTMAISQAIKTPRIEFTNAIENITSDNVKLS